MLARREREWRICSKAERGSAAHVWRDLANNGKSTVHSHWITQASALLEGLLPQHNFPLRLVESLSVGGIVQTANRPEGMSEPTGDGPSLGTALPPKVKDLRANLQEY